MKKKQNEELGRLSPTEFKESDKTPISIVLDNIRSLHNIGSVFRSSDVFRIEKIYLCGITAQPPHRDIQKTALGATETVSWEYHDTTASLIKTLKEDTDKEIIAIEQVYDAQMLNEYQPNPDKHLVLVFGNEVFGVSQEVIDLCDSCIEIPQLGSKHSLNIAVCTGIVLWDLTIKQGQSTNI